MGMCISCSAVKVGTFPATTARLIMHDGQLREFARPVKVSEALQGKNEKEDPAWFVCDADGMDFDGVVSAVTADVELRPGQIYFVLPISMLRRPLKADELAALAVKASSALMRAVGGGGDSKLFGKRSASPQPLVFAEETAECAVVPFESNPGSPRLRRPRNGGGRGRDFATSLGAIAE